MPGQMLSFPGPSPRGPDLAALLDGGHSGLSVSLSLGESSRALSCPGLGALCSAFFTGLALEPVVFTAGSVLLGAVLFLISLPSLLAPSLPPLLPLLSSHLLHPSFPLLLLPSPSSGPLGDLKGIVRCRDLGH